MPPRTSLQGSFSVTDANNEVVCPLKNQDGSACRKRCLGEKRYRSMQEHIRRAHPEHYIPKLPATEESFLLMVNTPPHERPPPQQPQAQTHINSAYEQQQPGAFDIPPFDALVYSSLPAYGQENFPTFYGDETAQSIEQRSSDEYRRGSLLPAASAAAALAQLHNHHYDPNYDSEQDRYSDTDGRQKPNFPYTGLQATLADDVFAARASPGQLPELLPSSMAKSPPERVSSLPPIQRAFKPNRPRKSSLTQQARKPKHERQKSREHARRLSYDRKAYSAEPGGNDGQSEKRWHDLIEAAASATEEDSRDLTPIPGSPQVKARNSLPPFNSVQGPQFQHGYKASPLQTALTPPPPDTIDMQPFSSVESSIESSQSGANFHMNSQALSDSSPQFNTSPQYAHPVQIYCAACRRLSILKESYACTECICGLCSDCVDALVAEQQRGRLSNCPKCRSVGGKFKPFQLDIR
ncbi:MAG: hypothetical protein M1821_004622 [Bathelium mastoideum]|nr:MAG: hypothetical protein M1821_004622 [Bathelium mastoideum]